MEERVKLHIVDFSGVNSHEPLEIGHHITLRRARPPFTWLKVGERVVLRDLENHTTARAMIMDRAEGITYDTIRKLEESALEGERSNLRTPEALEKALREFYPDSDEGTVFLALEFFTYLHEVRN